MLFIFGVFEGAAFCFHDENSSRMRYEEKEYFVAFRGVCRSLRGLKRRWERRFSVLASSFFTSFFVEGGELFFLGEKTGKEFFFNPIESSL